MSSAALRLLPAETGHGIALRGLSAGFGPRERSDDFPVLAQDICGLHFANPVAVSAGFDKNAAAIAGARRLGSGFVEIGGVTPRAQIGNPKPRLFRLAPDRAAINRMGFNNEGSDAVLARVQAAQNGSTPLGVNLAANSDSTDPANDFIALVEKFAPAADFLTIDVSCPNSANGQVFLDPGALADLLTRLNATREASSGAPVMFAKLAPDLEDSHLSELLDVMLAAKIDAITLCNTTTARPDSLQSNNAGERGGLSGAPLFEMATEMLRKVYARTNGTVPLIGVGGVMSGADAYTKIRAGASLVQLYTGLVYEGPGLIQTIKHDIAERLTRDGFSNLSEAVGLEHRS
ncbi:MAG: quinone-dependent dihydroorotate dehydrogenase [Alphaproteobacteria bacterium]|nr:quinone-dependent dihydroorotate dehydrogenase [Alphaproteobacteria bacterium]